jgi:hypothetical protein
VRPCKLIGAGKVGLLKKSKKEDLSL